MRSGNYALQLIIFLILLGVVALVYTSPLSRFWVAIAILALIIMSIFSMLLNNYERNFVVRNSTPKVVKDMVGKRYLYDGNIYVVVMGIVRKDEETKSWVITILYRKDEDTSLTCYGRDYRWFIEKFQEIK